MYIPIWLIIIAGILVYFYYHNKEKHSNLGQDKKSQPANIDEETVFEIETNFEKKLQNTYLPDAITRKDLYIYKNLMRNWYDQLASKGRYNEPMIQKIRQDWLDYMSSLEDRNTYSYLSFETENEESDAWREKHINASKKVFAIEDGFASAIGKEAIKELSRVRDESSFNFDVNGNVSTESHKDDNVDIPVESLFKEDESSDELYEEAKKITMEHDVISTTILQRKLKVGYARSARLIDKMEEDGVIGKENETHSRKVLMPKK